jgi:hypothetical protein
MKILESLLPSYDLSFSLSSSVPNCLPVFDSAILFCLIPQVSFLTI